MPSSLFSKTVHGRCTFSDNTTPHRFLRFAILYCFAIFAICIYFAVYKIPNIQRMSKDQNCHIQIFICYVIKSTVQSKINTSTNQWHIHTVNNIFYKIIFWYYQIQIHCRTGSSQNLGKKKSILNQLFTKLLANYKDHPSKLCLPAFNLGIPKYSETFPIPQSQKL